ncbi:CCR4-NOT transcription complex subunit 7 [Papilio machaon]|uniref:poly(A)-specific ribonuclease n=1 Tax=Papilio machaon TaxID=76193 RepID=A0A194QVX4_PAPMA|nr:CCR4-NOT transcription complex subunit 7 [Papilio machaon]
MSQPPPPPPPPPPPSSQAIDDCGIKDVWNYNLHEEFHIIRQIVQKYHWVAMDTEFPGVVARPIGEFRSTADYQYQLLRCNVDLLRIIQLGLTFMDENGQTPSGYTTWQFNFKFSLQEDMYAQDSIDLLQNSGLQFRKHEEEGIDPLEFAELIMTSGLVLMDNIKWLSFHSGYDFGYLLKLLTDQNLPSEENDFFQSLRMYFPTIYDVKYLMKLCKNLKGGLQEVADQLELRRVGPQHQAGSDSHLTGMAFFKIKESGFVGIDIGIDIHPSVMKEKGHDIQMDRQGSDPLRIPLFPFKIFFDDNIENSSGHLYGLGAPFSATANNFPDGGDGKPS